MLTISVQMILSEKYILGSKPPEKLTGITFYQTPSLQIQLQRKSDNLPTNHSSQSIPLHPKSLLQKPYNVHPDVLPPQKKTHNLHLLLPMHPHSLHLTITYLSYPSLHDDIQTAPAQSASETVPHPLHPAHLHNLASCLG